MNTNENAAEWVELERLHGWDKNPKKHPDAQMRDLMKSIKRFGWGAVILARPNGEIIAGHGRMEAAKRLGMAKVPVRFLDLDPAEAHLLALADNKLTEVGEWDDAMLREILASAKGDGADLDGLGWSDEELLALLANDPTDGLTDPDDVPEVQETPVSVLGDVWLLGRHRITCGDSTDATVVERVLAGVKPHLMVTDPPYGVEYDPEWRARAGLSGNTAAHGKVLNDDRADWREAWTLFPGDVAYVWHGEKQLVDMGQQLRDAGFDLRNLIVWGKSQLAIGRGHYHSQHETCWYAVRKGSTGHWVGDRKQTTLWSIPKPRKNETGHGTQKPVECMKRPIENNSSPGQAVYEPFSGSGTTIIACEMTARACHAVELNPAYVDVAVRRWQAFTAQTATLEGDGRSFDEVSQGRAAPPSSDVGVTHQE